MGEGDEHEEQKMRASHQQMSDSRVPLHVRDYCAHVLIPLNKCRRSNFFSPLSCEHERHDYEVCLYKQYELRRAIKKNGGQEE